MRKALELAREFTYVVVDAPPCLELSDALIMSRLVDGVVLVVRSGRTPRNLVTRARDHFRRAQAPVLGVALNGVDLDTFDYGSYYGGYYSSESETEDSAREQTA